MIDVGALSPNIMDENGALVIAVCLMVLAATLYIIIRTPLYWSTINRLLTQDGQAKSQDKNMANKVESVYWRIIFAFYRACSLVTNDWGQKLD